MIAVSTSLYLSQSLPVHHVCQITVELKKVKINIIEDVVDEFFVSLRYPVECPLQTFEDWDYFFPQDDLELPLSLNVHASHRFNGFVIVLILDTLLDWLVPISPAYNY